MKKIGEFYTDCEVTITAGKNGKSLLISSPDLGIDEYKVDCPLRQGETISIMLNQVVILKKPIQVWKL